MTTTKRYRASKKAIHLDSGWKWLVWDEAGVSFVDGPAFDSKEAAEAAAREFNEYDAAEAR